MADTKDSALTAATLPMDGSEILKVVQGGNDRKVAGESLAVHTDYASGDTAINSGAANTLTDITGLTFPVVSGGVYWFRAVVMYTSGATTTGSRWTVNVAGAAPTSIWYWSQYTLTASTWTYNMPQTSVQLPAASNATSVIAGSVAIIEGYVVAAASSTSVQIQGAREVTTDTITAKTGSVIQWQRLA